MKEQIKTIVGTTYRVSDRGIIINKHGRPLIGCKGNKQHVTHLMINKKVKHVQTCRLIWETFNGVIPKGKVVDHIDGNVFIFNDSFYINRRIRIIHKTKILS